MERNWLLLGLAVIKMAVRDAKRGDTTARNWLLFNEVCGLILDVAGLDRQRVRLLVLRMG